MLLPPLVLLLCGIAAFIGPPSEAPASSCPGPPADVRPQLASRIRCLWRARVDGARRRPGSRQRHVGPEPRGSYLRRGQQIDWRRQLVWRIDRPMPRFAGLRQRECRWLSGSQAHRGDARGGRRLFVRPPLVAFIMAPLRRPLVAATMVTRPARPEIYSLKAPPRRLLVSVVMMRPPLLPRTLPLALSRLTGTPAISTRPGGWT